MTIDEQVPSVAQQTFLDGLARMLDAGEPAALDRLASTASRCDVEWFEVVLAHAHREDWSLRVLVSDDEVYLTWLVAHASLVECDEADGRSWMSVAVDLVEAIMRGEYEIRTVERLFKRYITHGSDGTDPEFPFVVQTQRRGRLPSLRRTAPVTERIDFEMRERNGAGRAERPNG